MKVGIEAAQLAGSKLKNKTHLLPLSLFVPAAEFYAADLCVGCGVSVGSEMLCDGETRRTLIDASQTH